MNSEMLLALLAAAVQSGTPILYATLGEILTEKSGVLNLGVEGMLMIGALTGFLVTLLSGNPLLGFLFAGLAGGLLAALHGLVCIVFLGNQVVSGLALTILGTGLADYLGTPYIGRKVAGFHQLSLPFLEHLPVLGPVFFRQDLLVYFSYLLTPLLWLFLSYSRWGLSLRGVGEHPDAAVAAGVSAQRFRWVGVTAGGFLVGLGGAYLSLAYTHLWTNHMSAGRGWIAVALVIFAFWNPGRAIIGAYLFGGVMAFQLRLQAMGTHLPSSLLLMLPYGLTVMVLVLSSWKGKDTEAPASLGVNIDPPD